MEPKKFTIPGTPVPLQRPRFAQGHVFDAQVKEKIAWTHQLKQQYHGDLFEGPLKVEIDFYFPIPKSRMKEHDQLIGTYKVYKPDLDNCIKFVLDNCISVLFEDDNIVCQIVSKKIYDDTPRTEFIISELITTTQSPEEVASKVRRQNGGRHHEGSTRWHRI